MGGWSPSPGQSSDHEQGTRTERFALFFPILTRGKVTPVHYFKLRRSNRSTLVHLVYKTGISPDFKHASPVYIPRIFWTEYTTQNDKDNSYRSLHIRLLGSVDFWHGRGLPFRGPGHAKLH